MKATVVAAARIAETHLRASPHLRRAGRRALALFAKLSPEARAFIRLRIMRLV